MAYGSEEDESEAHAFLSAISKDDRVNRNCDILLQGEV
jgi:hypothetical protein